MPISQGQRRGPRAGDRPPTEDASREAPQTQGIMARGDVWFGSVEGEGAGESRDRSPRSGEGEEALGVLLVGHPHGPRILEILDTWPA